MKIFARLTALAVCALPTLAVTLSVTSAEAQDRRTFLQNCAKQTGVRLDDAGNYRGSAERVANYEACKAHAPSAGSRRTTPRPYSGTPSRSQLERDAARAR